MLIVLVIAGVVLAMATTITRRRDDTRLETAAPQMRPPTPPPGGHVQYANVTGGRANQAGGDIRTGMPAGYVVLCLLIVATLSFAVFIVAVKFGPDALPGSDSRQQDGAEKQPSGPPLITTVTRVDNLCNRYAFARGNSNASTFIASHSWPKDLNATVRNVFAAGGYARDELTIRFVLQSRLPEAVTVTDVRLVEIQHAAPTQGADLTYETCGGEPTSRLIIPINGPNRGPFRTGEGGSRTSEHFFDAETINVAPGKKASVILGVEFFDEKWTVGSYTFRVEIAYEVDGRTATKMIDNFGEPFRLTRQACKPDTDTRTDTGETQRPLRKFPGVDWC
ncbi:hypothetical protein [Paractinoplanes rishiriensis]|nr:hypothetical protein [Actinoplanes rishiriensis]